MGAIRGDEDDDVAGLGALIGGKSFGDVAIAVDCEANSARVGAADAIKAREGHNSAKGRHAAIGGDVANGGDGGIGADVVRGVKGRGP